MNEYINKHLNDFLRHTNNEKEGRLYLCKKYLEDTDYEIIKLYETFVQGGSIITMLAELKEVLQNRKQAREEINKLESEV